MRLDIKQAVDENEIEDAKRLFTEYAEWLGFSLCFQGFDAELAELPGKYAMPGGRLYLAYVDGTAVGCIAMRPLADGICEMKRLYVKKEARGLGLGNKLVEKTIADARDIGYLTMRLDTYPPKMGKAVEMYRRYGFTEIAPYYDNPHAGSGEIFMELDLKR